MHDSGAGLSLQEPSLAAYFQRRLADCARDIDPSPQEDTCWYLSQLLDRFGRADSLFSWEDGSYDLRPLALLYGDAVEARDDRQRCLLLQQLGDMALFLGALFPERYERKGIGQDYFVGMGGSAYDYLALQRRKPRATLQSVEARVMRLEEMLEQALAARPPSNADGSALGIAV